MSRLSRLGAVGSRSLLFSHALAALGWFGCDQSFADGALAGQLPRSAHSFIGFPRALFGGLFICPATAQFTEETLSLELPLEEFQGLVDVVVTDENLDSYSPSVCVV
jgi:hypothetical protein